MTAVQIVALTIGLMALLLLTVVRNDLLAAWQQAAPPDAPNRFVINIQPDQQADVRRMLAETSAAGGWIQRPAASRLWPGIRSV